MKTETHVILEHDEVHDILQYQLITSCVGSSFWNSGKINREKEKTFSLSEIEMIKKIYKKAHTWYLITGVPNEVIMPLAEFNLWKKLKDFCVKNMTLYGKERNND